MVYTVDEWLQIYRSRYHELRTQGYNDTNADRIAKAITVTATKIQWEAIRDGWRDK